MLLNTAKTNSTFNDKLLFTSLYFCARFRLNRYKQLGSLSGPLIIPGGKPMNDKSTSHATHGNPDMESFMRSQIKIHPDNITVGQGMFERPERIICFY